MIKYNFSSHYKTIKISCFILAGLSLLMLLTSINSFVNILGFQYGDFLYSEAYKSQSLSSLALTGTLFVITLVLAYCLRGYMLSKISQKCRINNSWLAWIPIGNLYLFGCLVDNKLGPIKNLSLVLPLTLVITYLSAFLGISWISWILGLIFVLLFLSAAYRFVNIINESKLIYLIITIFFVLLFILTSFFAFLWGITNYLSYLYCLYYKYENNKENKKLNI